jgi:hypothetical protein
VAKPPRPQCALNPQILVINAEMPVRTVQEFIKYAKERLGKLNYGIGNAHFCSAMPRCRAR